MARLEIVALLKCTQRDFELCDLDEAVIVAALSKTVMDAFSARSLSVPSWLLDQQRAVERFIKVKTEEELELRLKRAEARRTTLATPTEQREALDAEIARLRAALGT